MKIQPRGHRLYAIFNPVEEHKVGRVFVPDQHSQTSRIGIVQAIGEDVEKYEIGDKILISYYSGVVVDLAALYAQGGGQDVHRILSEEEVLGIIEE